MDAILGFGLILGGAWALLRLLSWVAAGWERGWWIHDPRTQSAVQVARDLPIQVKPGAEEPAFNMDGTPMNGGLDMKMKPYGFF